MNINATKEFTEKTWDKSIIPQLMEYIRIPAVSPGFDKDWAHSGFLLKAARLIEDWCYSMELNNCRIQTIVPEGRIPFITN